MTSFTNVILLLIVALVAVFAQNTLNIDNVINAPDMPNFTPNLKTIPAGSLVIPMDPSTQVLVPKTGKQSVLPYGLVIRTLWNNISVSWAITTGKALGGVDFSARTARSNWQAVASSGGAAANTNWGGWANSQTTSYSGGPFVIPQQYVSRVLAAWSRWQSNPSSEFKTVDPSVYNTVNVHILQEDTVIDIRHVMNTHPKIGVSNLAGNAGTQTAMMGCIYQASQRDPNCPIQQGNGAGALFYGGRAGCTAFNPQDHAGLDWNTHYETYDCGSDVAALTGTTCLATFSEPHWEWDTTSGPSYREAVRQFVLSGANFLAQCASTNSYESYASQTRGEGTFLTTNGIAPLYASDGINRDPSNSQNTITNYPDLPVTQYVGAPSSVMWGAVPDFYNYFPNGDGTPAGWSGYTGQNPNFQSYNNFKPDAFPLITNQYDSANDGNTRGRAVMVAGGAKYNSDLVLGSNVWYLGGHSWVNLADGGTENNRRFFFNAMMVPADRPSSCGFTFCAAGTTCDARNPCETCTCNAAGSGPSYTPIAGCCLNNGQCPDPCTTCNTNSHTCELIPGCCLGNIHNCTGDCQQCSVVSQTTAGTCVGTPGCCTSDPQCTTTSACVHCTNKACVTTPAPDCCDAPSDCTGTCMTCASNNTCTRKLPLTQCCLSNADCGGDACQACNLQTNKCYKIPGCCNSAADCGTSPCVDCDANHKCFNKADCCTLTAQCGTCQVCSNTTNKCIASPDKDCCDPNEPNPCGQCRQCAVGTGGSRTCTILPQCCINPGDCETCQVCNNSQCLPVPNCCIYDTQCSGCDVCENYTCVTSHQLSCCYSNDDCELARQEMYLNPNATDIPACDLICNFDNNAITGQNGTGVCQSICSSPKNWTGLIVGLAAGVPLGLLLLAAIAAGLIAFLLWKRDALTGALLNKGADPGMNANTNPAFDSPVKVGTSGL